MITTPVDKMVIAIVAFSIIFIVLFFMQLNQGALGGIQGLTGQELELFKENKERTFVKYMRRITIFMVLLIISLSIAAIIMQNHMQ